MPLAGRMQGLRRNQGLPFWEAVLPCKIHDRFRTGEAGGPPTGDNGGSERASYPDNETGGGAIPYAGQLCQFALPAPQRADRPSLDDDEIYLCSQVEASSGGYYGVAAGLDFLLVSQYGENGAEPELVLLRRRKLEAGETEESSQ